MKIELIPAIDIIDGKCVRLTKGDYACKTIYNDNPVEVAKEFETMGFKRLHVVDLDGAKSRHIVNDGVLRDMASATNLVIDFGGQGFRCRRVDGDGGKYSCYTSRPLYGLDGQIWRR